MTSELSKKIEKLSTQYDEILVHILEIKSSMNKQNSDLITKRLEKLESSTHDIHFKLDALNSIEITTVSTPAKVKRVVKKDNIIEESDVVEAAEEIKKDEQIKFINITDYFKYMWVNHRDIIYSKNVITEEKYLAFYETIKDSLDKGKKNKNEIVLQQSIANKIWRLLLDKKSKDIVKALKSDYETNVQKNNSHEIDEEAEV